MKILSNWRSVRLWETQVERDLHRDYSLRTHGMLIGTFTLLLMWGVSALQMRPAACRFAGACATSVTLGVGYLGYLLVLRWWARRLVEGRRRTSMSMRPTLTSAADAAAAPRAT